MDVYSLAIWVAVAIALVLLVIYFVAGWRERGRDPHYAREVYLYDDSAIPAPDPAKTAAMYGAAVATSAQIAMYATAGGGAHGYGIDSAGEFVGLTPARGGGPEMTQFPSAGLPTAYGIWLYGPKPRRGTKAIAPFSCAHWFHPAGR